MVSQILNFNNYNNYNNLSFMDTTISVTALTTLNNFRFFLDLMIYLISNYWTCTIHYKFERCTIILNWKLISHRSGVIFLWIIFYNMCSPDIFKTFDVLFVQIGSLEPDLSILTVFSKIFDDIMKYFFRGFDSIQFKYLFSLEFSNTQGTHYK